MDDCDWPSWEISPDDWLAIDEACESKSTLQPLSRRIDVTSNNSVCVYKTTRRGHDTPIKSHVSPSLTLKTISEVTARETKISVNCLRASNDIETNIRNSTGTQPFTVASESSTIHIATTQKSRIPDECVLNFDSSPEIPEISFDTSDFPPALVTPHLERAYLTPVPDPAPAVVDIIFDLETTGMCYHYGDEIIEIAACTADRKNVLDVYVLPSCGQVSDFITRFTGIEVKADVNGVRSMYADGQFVESVTLDEGLKMFVEFLVKQANGGKVNLIGHNCLNFDFRFLYPSMENSSCFSQFEEVVHAFTDTLRVAKVAFPGRKSYKQDVLVQDFLNETYVAHNAKRDVTALSKLLNLIPREHVVMGMYTYTSVKAKFIHWQQTQDVIGSFWFLTHDHIISKPMAKKIAESGLALTHLKKAYMQGSYQGLHSLLSAKNAMNKPRVTAKEAIIRSIFTYFEKALKTT